jgi:hypothetical protein
LTISNIGSQGFNVTGLVLQKGSASPFTLTPSPSTLPIALTISGASSSTSVALAPAAIPSMNVDPNDPLAYSDTLTVSTDAAGDTPHTVQLVMQPLGAIISGSQPPTAWSFGTVGEGSIAAFLGTTIRNSGNLAASVTLQPASALSLPSVFGLQNTPVTLLPNATTSLVGQFTPNAPNASWSGEGSLTVTADAFCAPLPMAWDMPQVSLSGASTSNPLVALTGSLVFPSTDCGSAPPGGQSVTLANLTNQPYSYMVALASGAHYTFADGGSRALPANGISTIVVNPVGVVPGPGVVPGSAPYADDLIVTVATTPATTLSQPIAWTLNGAVLSLPQGAGPFGSPGSNFYVADTMSDLPLPLSNSGTDTASVQLAIQPPGAFSLLPASVDIVQGIPALPGLVSASSAPPCSAPASGTATFLYSGPVCNPLPLTSVNVQYCAGAYPGAP